MAKEPTPPATTPDPPAPPPVVTRSTTKAAKANTVTVGCKLPHGIIMQLDRMVDQKAPDGKTMEMKALRHGDSYTLNGANSSKVIGGYGITRNIPSEFFAAWMEQNKYFTPVVRGLIFATDSLDDTEDEAENRADVRSGLEGIDPSKPAPNLKPASDKDE